MLKPCAVDTGTTTYTLHPGTYVATLLSVTNSAYATLDTFEVAEDGSPGGIYTLELDLPSGGMHSFAVSFDNDYYEPGVADRNLYVDYLQIEGPTDQFASAPPGYALVFTCDPETAGFEEDTCAREIIAGFGARAWRRILTVEGVKAGAGLEVIDRALAAVSGAQEERLARSLEAGEAA